MQKACHQYWKHYNNVISPESGGIGGGMPFFNIKFILIFTTQKTEANEEEFNSNAGQIWEDFLEVVLFTDDKTQALRGEVTCLRSNN